MRPRSVPPLFIAGFLVLALAGCGGDDGASQADKTKAVVAAKLLYQGKAKSLDLSAGPCLAESIPGLSDWVVDIAHDPRQDVDDQPQNQCQRFRDGDAHHFVELTPSGQLIRAQ
jgi:hypothetical protein